MYQVKHTRTNQLDCTGGILYPFQAYWMQAICNQDPGTLICKHWLHYVYIGICVQSDSQVLISLVVWLQSVGKVSNEMIRCGKLGISLCALYLYL